MYVRRIDLPQPPSQTMSPPQAINRAPTLLKATPFRSRGGDRHAEAGEPVARLVRSEADGGVEGSWRPSIKSLSCRNPVGYRTMRCRDIGGHWPENATA